MKEKPIHFAELNLLEPGINPVEARKLAVVLADQQEAISVLIMQFPQDSLPLTTNDGLWTIDDMAGRKGVKTAGSRYFEGVDFNYFPEGGAPTSISVGFNGRFTLRAWGPQQQSLTEEQLEFIRKNQPRIFFTDFMFDNSGKFLKLIAVPGTLPFQKPRPNHIVLSKEALMAYVSPMSAHDFEYVGFQLTRIQKGLQQALI